MKVLIMIISIIMSLFTGGPKAEKTKPTTPPKPTTTVVETKNQKNFDERIGPPIHINEDGKKETPYGTFD